MTNTYWHKQTPDKPLFPDLLWSRPQNQAHAGKLLIVGGNLYGFAAPAEAYAEAMHAGVGVARVILPRALKSTAGKLLDTVEYLPSTPSGSLATQALDELLTQATWADGVLLAGDLGHNSETATLLEKFMAMYSGQLTLAKDAVDDVVTRPTKILDRQATTLVLTFEQLQRLGTAIGLKQPFTSGMDLLHLVDSLHELSASHTLSVITKHLDMLLVGSGGQVSTTKLMQASDIWRTKAATHAAVWWLQNPDKPFEALTAALYEISK